MRISLLCVGDELLDGRVLDTNARYLGQRLAEFNQRLVSIRTVGDDEATIGAAVIAAIAECDLLVVSGGLGPTRDDVTRQAIAAAANVELLEDPGAKQRLQAFYTSRGRVLDAINQRQALVPDGATLHPNLLGTAEPFETKIGAAAVLALPGVPREYTAIIDAVVLPRITGSSAVTHTLTFAGIAESRVAAWVESFGGAYRATISYLADFPYVRLRIRADDDAEIAALREHVAGLGAAWLLPSPARSAAEAVRDRCASRRRRIATAESCTGGLIARELTELAGSSRFFERGVVTYSNEAKTELLGVDAELIVRDGAVSATVAAAMAEGLLARAPVDAVVAVTGIAGPGGGSDEKPVGTVFLAASSAEGTVVIAAFFGGRTRTMVRELTACLALRLLELQIDGDPMTLANFAGVRSMSRTGAKSPIETTGGPPNE